MAKYEKLGPFLDRQTAPEIPMSFAEIERVTGHPLPRSARYPAWWSNNPSNNVMTKIWLAAGFKTEQVDVEARRLVFRRVDDLHPAPARKKGNYPMEHDQPASASGMADAGRTYTAMGKPKSPHPGKEPLHPFHPAFGSMKGLITVAPGVDLTGPAADPKSWKHRG